MAKGETEDVVMMHMFPETEEHGTILKVEDLSRAILLAVGEKNIMEEQSMQMAQHMMNFFGFQDAIIDNVLEPPDRDIFYTMEDYGLMSTEREETTLWDGREWRINYWNFRREKILSLLRNPPEKKKEDMDDRYRDIYSGIPDDIWSSRN